jgi:iron complex outermembrane receptor protein
MRRLYLYVFLILFLRSGAFGQFDTTDVSKLFEMSLADLMNQEVITASKFVQKSAQSASSVSVITEEDIKNFNYSTLGEALNSQRGMYLSNDKNYLYVGSRGFSRPADYNNRIVIMIDGHILNEVVYGSAFMGNELGLNLKNVEKIEIIRGPGASLYGSGAMLNIVNVITKKGLRTDGLFLSAGTGSYGRNEFSAGFGKKIDDIDISVSGSGGLSKGENYYFAELDDPATNNGVSDGKDWEKFAGFQAGITKNNFKLSGGYSTRLKGIPTGAFETDLDGDVSSTDDRYYLEASYRKEFKKNSLLLIRTYYDDYCYKGSYPAGGIDLFDRSFGRWAGSEIQYYSETGKRNSIISGIDYKYIFRADYKEWDNSAIYFDDNFPFSFFSLYIHDQFTIARKLTFTGGLRYDHYSIFGQAVSPRAAIVYEYSEASSVKLLYSEAFRIPNIYEAFYESEDAQKSNPDIKPEKIRAFELAWGHNISEQLYGSLSLYRFTMKNLIDLTIDETDGLTMFRNINEARGTGLELELRYQSSKRNTGFINLSLQKSDDPNSGELLSNSPEILIKSGLVFPLSRFLNLSPEFFYESGRYTLYGNKTGDVYLFNLSVRTMKFLKYFDVSLKARNLFNLKYKYPGGYEHVQDALIQDSRSLFVQLNAQF